LVIFRLLRSFQVVTLKMQRKNCKTLQKFARGLRNNLSSRIWFFLYLVTCLFVTNQPSLEFLAGNGFHAALSLRTKWWRIL
jgi:hypothetical protein